MLLLQHKYHKQGKRIQLTVRFAWVTGGRSRSFPYPTSFLDLLFFYGNGYICSMQDIPRPLAPFSRMPTMPFVR
jgi:hypothetical protein